MDVSRSVLDNLMGRDRNKPNDLITQRDHYSNPDVCKPFLVCFCFNTLFPNTTYDQGPCQKRHDTYLKTMFDSDVNRAPFQREYMKECIHWIQRRLQQVEKKTKQNQGVIDNKSNFPTDRPKQILDRILAIDQDIQKLIIQSQKYGQEGRIDDSARCLEEVQKLRQRRKEIQLMGSDMTNAQKQQKICLTCGAIQTINDTEKRIQTHLEGKIHQGFLKLRHQVQTLRIRLEVLNKLNPPEKKQDRKQERKQQRRQEKKQERRQERRQDRRQDKQNQERKVQRPKQQQHLRNVQNRVQRQPKEVKQVKQQRQRSDSASRKRKRQRQRSRQKSKQRKQRHQQRQTRRKDSREHDRRSRQRSKDKKQRKHRDSKQREHKQKHRKQHKQHKQSKQHKKKHKKDRSRSRQNQLKAEY